MKTKSDIHVETWEGVWLWSKKTFRENWLTGIEIEELTIEINREKAQLDEQKKCK